MVAPSTHFLSVPPERSMASRLQTTGEPLYESQPGRLQSHTKPRWRYWQILLSARGLSRFAPRGDCRHLEGAAVVGGGRSADLMALDDAMNALARLDARKAQVVEMRFFGGLSVEETAEVLGVSPITVMRDWSTAKAWLYRE